MDLLDIAIAKQLAGGGGGSGTDNYNDLSNLPKINDVTLSGNKSSSALGLQSEITSENKLDSDLIDDTNQDNKFVTSTEKNTWNAKQNAIDADHKLNADYVDDSTSTNKFVTASDKEAWNAKQSAIDSEHKLSSSLVSFTTAEAAALASGIDSSKVGQISTNQTNILSVQNATEELVDNGAKNKFNFDAWKNVGVVNGTKTITDNRIKLLATSANAYTEYETYPSGAEIPATANENYVISWEYTRSGGAGRGYVYVYFIGSTGTASVNAIATTKKIEFTTPTGTTGLRISISQAEVNLEETYYDLMICTKAEYDISPNYVPYALPNYDLTVREQQDRNALVELVDNGAKNLIDLTAIKEINTDGTWSGNVFTHSNGGIFTVNQDDTIAVNTTQSTGNCYFWIAKNVSMNSTETYILSGCPSGGSASTYFIKLNNSYKVDSGNGTKFTGISTDDVVIGVLNGTNISFTYKPMICTEADWKISQNFEPFALPNADLTVREAEDRAALVECVDNGAKNKVAINKLDTSRTTNGITFTNNHDGTITSTGTVPTTATYNAVCLVSEITLPAGVYHLSGCPLDGEASSTLKWYLRVGYGTGDTILTEDNGQGAEFVLSETTLLKISCVVRYNTTEAATAPTEPWKPMICTLADWKISHQFVQHTLPNTDLTVLEAEDRAALVDAVDNGDKNKLDFATLSNPTLNNATVTKTDSSIVVTSSGAYARAVYSFDLKAGTYKLRLSASDITNASGSDTGMFVGLYKSSTITSNNELCRIYCTTAGDKYVEFNHAGGTVYVAFYINTSSTSYINSYTISQMMICTEADWKVSQKYVPFTLKPPRIIYKSATTDVDTTEAIISDLTFSIPANYMARVSINETYDNVPPSKLRLAQDTSMTSTENYKEPNNSGDGISMVAVYRAGYPKTIYVSTAAIGSGKNTIDMLIELFEV